MLLLLPSATKEPKNPMGKFVKFLCFGVIWNPWIWIFKILVGFDSNTNLNGFKSFKQKIWIWVLKSKFMCPNPPHPNRTLSILIIYCIVDLIIFLNNVNNVSRLLLWTSVINKKFRRKTRYNSFHNYCNIWPASPLCNVTCR